MTEHAGVDYSSGRPGGAALAAAGMAFAARYLSHTEKKNLTASEAADLAAHGVSCVVVWETTASRAGAGRAAGIADAKAATAQATACGMPAGRPIFFAVDWDAAPSVVASYFEGVASVLGVARTGVYGGYRVVAHLLDLKLAAWAWQTSAWSQGHWDARAHIRQYASTVRIGGVTCDKDTAYGADYGQWMPGKTPLTEDDMTPDQDARLKRVEAALADLPHSQWAYRNEGMAKKDPKLPQAYGYLIQTNAAVKGLTAQVAALTATVSALATKGGLTAAEITAAAQAGADAALAELGDALTKEN
jgi:hypothetical protein